MAIPVPPSVEAAARSLEFYKAHGGPLVVVPRLWLHAWRGFYDEEGEADMDGHTDYARARAVRGVVGFLGVGEGRALVLPTPEATAFHRLSDGGMLVRWFGADSAAGLLGAALGAREGWTVLPESWRMPPGGAVLMAAGTHGRDLGPGDALDLPLSTGIYTVEVLRDWDGDVIRARGVEEVMVQAIRLRRLLRSA